MASPPPPSTSALNSQSPYAVLPTAPEPPVAPAMQNNPPNVVLLDCGHADTDDDDGNSSPNTDVSLCKLCRIKEDLENAAKFFDHQLSLHGTGGKRDTKGAMKLHRKARLALLEYDAKYLTEGSSTEYDFATAAELARKKGPKIEAEVMGAKKKKKGKKGKKKTTATRDDSTSGLSAAATTYNDNDMDDSATSSSSIATQPSTSALQLKSSLKSASTMPKYAQNSRTTTFSPVASIENPAFPNGYQHCDPTEYRDDEFFWRPSETYAAMQWATQAPAPKGASEDEKKDWGFWNTSGFHQEGWAEWEQEPSADQQRGEEIVAEEATGEQGGGRQTRSMTKAAIQSKGRSESK